MSPRPGLAFALIGTIFMGAPLTLRFASAAQEPTASEIIDSCIDALGGRASWNSVQSLRYSGNFSTFSVPRPFVIFRKRPNLYRFEHFFESAELTYVHDGDLSWWINHAVFSHVPWAEPAPPVHARAIAADADFGLPLLEALEKGHRIESLGRYDLDGQETYHLKVQLAKGAMEDWYVDVETFLPVARISRGADSRREVDQRQYFTDYRKVAGILLPHRIEIELGFRYQSLEIKEVEVNPHIAPDLFRMPLPDGMESLQGLAGTWDVHVKSRAFPRMPWVEGSATSVIRSLAHGALLEEEISYTVHAASRHIRRSITYDRFRDLFRVTRFDTLTSHLDVYEGTAEEDGDLVLSNLKTGTSWKIGEEPFYAREIFHDIATNSFKVSWEISSDNGATWNALTQLVYQRKSPP